MPLNRYINMRDIPDVGTFEHAELAGAAATSNEIVARLAPDIDWADSHVAAGKTFCNYLAKDEDVIRRVGPSGFPAMGITAIRKTIDPTTETDG